MDIGIDGRLCQVAAFVSSSAKSDNLNRLNRLNDCLDRLTEVRKRGSDPDLVILSRLLDLERFEILNLSRDQLLCREVLIRDNLEDAMLSASEESVADLSVLHRERVVHDADATLVLDREADEYSHRWQVAFDEVTGPIERVDPDDRIPSIERLEGID